MLDCAFPDNASRHRSLSAIQGRGMVLLFIQDDIRTIEALDENGELGSTPIPRTLQKSPIMGRKECSYVEEKKV